MTSPAAALLDDKEPETFLPDADKYVRARVFMHPLFMALR
jgi:hypothetical protein